MTTLSTPAAGGAGGALTAHVAHAPHPAKPAIDRLGLWLFIASESMLFLTLAVARFYLAGFERPEGVNLALGLALTVDLLLSSLLSYRAVTKIRSGDRAGFLSALAATIVLGVLFIGGVAMEWASAEFGPGTPYGTAFFSMTGLHVSHLLSGLVVLVLVYRLGRRGSFSADDHWGVTAAVRYWTFVDAMWLLVVFPTLYLL